MESRLTPENKIHEDKFLNALADAFRLQEAVINATELAIISTTREGIINSFNTSAEQLLGYSQHEVIDRLNALSFYDLDEVVSRTDIADTRRR